LRLRSSLSQLPPRRRSVMLTGRKTATRSFYADAQFVSGIRSLVTVAAASRHMTSTTTGFGSIAAAAPIAGRPLLSFRCSLFLTRITVWWRGARHCSDALRSNVRGKKLCRSSRTPIVRPIPPQFNAGRAGWTVPNYWCPSSARRSFCAYLWTSPTFHFSNHSAATLRKEFTPSPVAPAWRTGTSALCAASTVPAFFPPSALSWGRFP